MVEYLKPMHWPRPVPTLWWVGDYADIRERIRRDGYLETEEIWLPNSDDGWQAFVGRHGDYGFGLDWREWEELIRAGHSAADRRAFKRHAAQAAQQQAQWEAEQRERRLAMEVAEAHKWEGVATAKAFWTRINPAYAKLPYVNCKILETGMIDGIVLNAGSFYWLPRVVAERFAKPRAA